jgi:large subunit ribosomal protein L25
MNQSKPAAATSAIARLAAKEDSLSESVALKAAPREDRGKNKMRRLRAAGKLPGVVYGQNQDPIAITLDPKVIGRLLRSSTGHNTIINLEVDGVDTLPTMMVDWQIDPVKNRLLHLDLLRIDMSKPVVVAVPIDLQGVPHGVKNQGGSLDVVNRDIQIEVLPDRIPESLPVDIKEMKLGSTLRAGSIELGEGVSLLSSENMVLCRVASTRTSLLADEEEEGAAVEGEEAAPAPEES